MVFVHKDVILIKSMNNGFKLITCLSAVVFSTAAVWAVTEGNTPSSASSGTDTPYNAIWLRNVFDLKPPPEKPTNTVPDVAPTPPPNVHLTGITTILGTSQAFFVVQPQPEPGKPPAAPRSYMLKEKERRDMLEVLEIHPKERTVKIKVEDLVSTITFETNKPSGGAPGSPVNVGRPGMPPNFGGGFPPPGGSPIPPRIPRNNIPGSGGYSPGNGQLGYSPGYQNQNGYSGRSTGAISGSGTGAAISSALFDPNSGHLNVQAPNVTMTPDEQMLAVAAYQKIQDNAIANGAAADSFPPLPPLPASLRGTDNNTQNNNNTSTTTQQPATTIPGWGQHSSGTLAK